MSELSRRHFLQRIAALGALSLNGCRPLIRNAEKAHVVVVGGGFGGATAAKTIRLLDETVKVTLIEPKANYITCPGSNWLFAGLTDIEKLTVDYHRLQNQYGIGLMTDKVIGLQPDRRRLSLASGLNIRYDRLILSPGIDFRWNSIEGYGEAAAQQFPHAWQAGPQTLLLAEQIKAMPEGGVVLITVPADPYRCPPGPYERASMVAWWLKRHNPRAKLIVLDHKRSFSKQALFEAGWRQHFGYGSTDSLIEWHTLADNPLIRLDTQNKTVVSEFGDQFHGDVLNIIPAQTAANIAVASGLTDAGGWCPVKPLSGQSVFDEYIHVIGDAAQYAPIPKSAFAANSEAKACALSVVRMLNEQPLPEPNWVNTCYSLITPEHGISVAGVYKLAADGAIALVKGAGGTSINGNSEYQRLEASYARAAYRRLVMNSFA